MMVESGREVALDDLVLYTLSEFSSDYVAMVVGLPGDRIDYDASGTSIFRNGQLAVTVPSGYRLNYENAFRGTLFADEYAVYVHDAPRPPVSVVINSTEIRGVIERVFRYSDLSPLDWTLIVLASFLTAVLVCLPYIDYAQRRPNSRFRMILLIFHSILALLLVAFVALLAAPGDPLGIGVDQPVWWWIPLAVFASWDAKVLGAAVVFVGLQWAWSRLRPRRLAPDYT